MLNYTTPDMLLTMLTKCLYGNGRGPKHFENSIFFCKLYACMCTCITMQVRTASKGSSELYDIKRNLNTLVFISYFFIGR